MYQHILSSIRTLIIQTCFQNLCRNDIGRKLSTTEFEPFLVLTTKSSTSTVYEYNTTVAYLTNTKLNKNLVSRVVSHQNRRWGSREGCSLLSQATIISLSDPAGRCGAYSVLVLAYIRSGDWPEYWTPDSRLSSHFQHTEHVHLHRKFKLFYIKPSFVRFVQNTTVHRRFFFRKPYSLV